MWFMGRAHVTAWPSSPGKGKLCTRHVTAFVYRQYSCLVCLLPCAYTHVPIHHGLRCVCLHMSDGSRLLCSSARLVALLAFCGP